MPRYKAQSSAMIALYIAETEKVFSFFRLIAPFGFCIKLRRSFRTPKSFRARNDSESVQKCEKCVSLFGFLRRTARFYLCSLQKIKMTIAFGFSAKGQCSKSIVLVLGNEELVYGLYSMEINPHIKTRMGFQTLRVFARPSKGQRPSMT
jgi:hypothetical protein